MVIVCATLCSWVSLGIIARAQCLPLALIKDRARPIPPRQGVCRLPTARFPLLRYMTLNIFLFSFSFLFLLCIQFSSHQCLYVLLYHPYTRNTRMKHTLDSISHLRTNHLDLMLRVDSEFVVVSEKCKEEKLSVLRSRYA